MTAGGSGGGGGEGLGVGTRSRSRSMIRSLLLSTSGGEGVLSRSRSTTRVRTRSTGGGLGDRSGRSMNRVPRRTRSNAGPRLGLRTRSRECSTTRVFRISSRTSAGGGGGGGGGLMLLALVLVMMRSLTTGDGDRGRGRARSTVSMSLWRKTSAPASERRASSRIKAGTRDSLSTTSSRSRTATSGTLLRGIGTGLGLRGRLSSRRS